MYLSKVLIKNYRSIQTLDIDLYEGKNVIVGRNNAGKSNIIKALDLVLGESSPTYNKSDNINESDFYNSDTTQPIYIFCKLNKANEEVFNFSSIKNSAIFGILKNGFEDDRKITDLIKEVESLFYFETEEGQAELDDKGSPFRKKRIGGKSYCGTNFVDEFKDTSTVLLGFKAEVIDSKIEKYLCMRYSKDGVYWKRACNASCLRNIFLQSAIIPAFRDTKDQLRISNYGRYGKLLKNFVKGDNAQLLQAFENVKAAGQDTFRNLQEKLSDKQINVAFPNTKISFQFNPERQEVYKNTQIYIDDGFNSPLQDKGSGIQSAVIIGLFDFYVREVLHNGCSLLAIEEPELYLHPHGRRVISDRLNDFLEGGKNQVILTTHASEFINSANENLNIIYVSKSHEGTSAKNIRFDTPQKKQLLIQQQNYELFFADFVIMTEDAKLFVHEVAKIVGNENKSLGENWINNNNISIINVGGKSFFSQYIECILNPLAIPYIIIADFDFLRDGGINRIVHDVSTNKVLSDVKSRIVNNGLEINLKIIIEKLESELQQRDLVNASITSKQIRDNIEIMKSKGKYKRYGDLSNESQKEVKPLIEKLSNEGIFLLPGELEDLYLEDKNPLNNKERGVIETMMKIVETGESIENYIDIQILKSLLVKVSSKYDSTVEKPYSTHENLKEIISVESGPHEGTKEDEDLPF